MRKPWIKIVLASFILVACLTISIAVFLQPDTGPDLTQFQVTEPAGVFDGKFFSLIKPSLSRDGARLLCNASDEAVLWDVETGAILAKFPYMQRPQVVSLSADGKRVVTTESNHTVSLWNADTGERERTVQLDFNPLYTHYSPDGRFLIVHSDSEPCTALLLDAGSGEPLHVFTPGNFYSYNPFPPDGSRLVTHSKNSLAIWNAITGERIHELTGQASGRPQAIFSPDGSKILAVSLERDPVEVDAETGQVIRTLKGHATERIYSLAYTPDSSCIFTGTPEETICWNSADGSIRYKLEGNFDLRILKPSPDGRLLLTVESHETRYSRWGEGTFAVRFLFPIQRSINQFMGRDNFYGREIKQYISLWNNETGERLRVIGMPTGFRADAAFLPDGKSLLTMP